MELIGIPVGRLAGIQGALAAGGRIEPQQDEPGSRSARTDDGQAENGEPAGSHDCAHRRADHEDHFGADGIQRIGRPPLLAVNQHTEGLPLTGPGGSFPS